jgi:7-cyano-7-deazaguanine synthase
MGIHAGDHSIYPDCRQEFRDIDFEAFKIGNWNTEKVNVYTPYLLGDKFDILKDGEVCCDKLKLNFDEVYKRTNTSYKPLFIKETNKWYSDYKSASSIERIEAFLKLGKPDPIEYAEVLPNGDFLPRTWDEAAVWVKVILNNYKK